MVAELLMQNQYYCLLVSPGESSNFNVHVGLHPTSTIDAGDGRCLQNMWSWVSVKKLT